MPQLCQMTEKPDLSRDKREESTIFRREVSEGPLLARQSGHLRVTTACLFSAIERNRSTNRLAVCRAKVVTQQTSALPPHPNAIDAAI
jgi:hypothetical protein